MWSSLRVKIAPPAFRPGKAQHHHRVTSVAGSSTAFPQEKAIARSLAISTFRIKPLAASRAAQRGDRGVSSERAWTFGPGGCVQLPPQSICVPPRLGLPFTTFVSLEGEPADECENHCCRYRRHHSRRLPATLNRRASLQKATSAGSESYCRQHRKAQMHHPHLIEGCQASKQGRTS